MNSHQTALPDDSRAICTEMGFDDHGDAWFDRIREAEAPLPFGALGPYELVAEVCRGGQGIVYRARQTSTGRIVALKRVLGGRLASPAKRRRFEREIEALCALHHPHIVAIWGADVVDGVPALAMEWIDGVSIRRWAAEGEMGRRSASDVLCTFLQVCDAVQYAHQRGVIHRDLKPSNILIDADSRPHVLDFGLARLVGPDAAAETSVTGEDEFVGTIRYASPEQLRASSDAADVRSDVYSLGVILYELLTGRMPYELAGGFAIAVRAIESQEPLSPSTLVAGFDRDLEAVMLRALAKDAGDRYQSVDAFAADLRCVQRGESPRFHAMGSASLLRLLRRHRRAAVCIGLTFAGLAVFAAAASVVAGRLALANRVAGEALSRERESRVQAEEQSARARAVETFLREMLVSADPMSGARHEPSVREVLDAAARRIDRDLGDQPQVEAATRLVLGVTYHSLGPYQDAESQLRRAAALQRSLHDGDHADTAAAMNELGHLLTSTGAYEEAGELLKQALAMRRRLLGSDHLDVATSLNNLAKLLFMQRAYEEAEPLWEESLRIREGQLGPVHPLVSASLHNLGGNHLALGDVDTAERLRRRALEIVRATRGEAHPDFAGVVHGLGQVMAARGDLDEAERLFRSALATKRKLLGDDHPNVAFTLACLAETLAAMGRFPEAEDACFEALAILEEHVSGDHPRVIALVQMLVEFP